MKIHTVVTIGGGSGTFPLLSHLRKYPLDIRAIVSTSDSGGSSRRLMDEYKHQLPLGDLRMSLVALAKNQGLWRNLFLHRFEKGDSSFQEIGGHSLGNLILKGLQDIHNGNILEALHDAEAMLETAGSVIPSTIEHSDIVAHLDDGTIITGETTIDTRGKNHPERLPAITNITLFPEKPHATTQAIDAISHADMIILGPGDLYTSILPNLLVTGIPQSIKDSHARIVYICNLMTKHGETDDYTTKDFLHIIEQYLQSHVDLFIVHDGIFPEKVLVEYAKEQAFPVSIDKEYAKNHVGETIIDHLIGAHEAIARHDGEKLVKLILHS